MPSRCITHILVNTPCTSQSEALQPASHLRRILTEHERSGNDPVGPRRLEVRHALATDATVDLELRRQRACINQGTRLTHLIGCAGIERRPFDANLRAEDRDEIKLRPEWVKPCQIFLDPER